MQSELEQKEWDAGFMILVLRHIDKSLKILANIEREAFDESGLNEEANTSVEYPEILQGALSMLADEAVSGSRRAISELTEARLLLAAIIDNFVGEDAQ